MAKKFVGVLTAGGDSPGLNAAIRGLGKFTEIGSALLIMGIAGGAIIPQAFAVLKQYADFQWVFAGLMVPCYLYILYYAQRGHRAGLPGGRAGAG